MPQGPIPVKATTANSTALNQSAAAVIKATPGILCRVVIGTVGTAGSLTFNDIDTVGGAAAANQIVSLAYGDLTAGQVIDLEFPCKTGIVLSAIPTGGVISVSYA